MAGARPHEIDRDVRLSVANGGKADEICSMRVLRILTHSGHKRLEIPQCNGC
jgi:hypothetical protein